ncbi:MAG: efflux RND transporter periplasmic adaptor subunit [Acidobacteriaceae bacterium]
MSTLSRALAVLGVVAMPAAGQSQDAGYVTVEQAAVTSSMEAYGQVEPITVLPVSAAEAGVVAGLNVLPGMHVRAGQELAHLKGPEIQSLLLQSQSDLRSARAQLTASQKSLAIQQQQLVSHLSTRQAVHQAESAVAQAQTSFDNAQSRLKAVRQMMSLSAPASATVLAVHATDGELVQAGQPILTLQIANRLWLKASYYGADLAAIRVGTTGTFLPADGSGPIPVRVSAVFGPLLADGGESIAMLPAKPGNEWRSGEFGTVTLHASPRMLVAVPTSALILDQGKWWVMVHTPHGDHPQLVVPGPSHGWQTFLERGLNPGAQVVVENAYLLFHRSISQRYQLPD